MPEFLTHPFDTLFAFVFGDIVQPALFALGLMDYWDEAYAGTQTMILGAVEISLLALLVVPLERFAPADAQAKGAAVRTDFFYTLINRLGVLPLVTFLITFPLEGAIESFSHEMGMPRPTLETLVPWLGAHPLAAFIAYLALFDLLGYWVHRAQHRFGWWWDLHAVHHSQQAMTVWTDSRNHFLDDLINAVILALVARAIGTPGNQFIWLVFTGRLVESLSHANVRFGYGPLSRLIVDPLFHRIHHAVGLGHEGPRRGVNFGVQLPVWDALFGTAHFGRNIAPTGIRDQGEGRDYGRGLLAQQWLALVRLRRRLGSRQSRAAAQKHA